MADLSNLKVIEESQALELLDPYTDEKLLNDAGKPMVIYLFGGETKLSKSVELELSRGDKAGKKISDVEMERRLYKKLARLTDRFDGVQMNGEMLVNDFDTAFNLYRDYPFLAVQAAQFISDRTHFLGNSQKTSQAISQLASG